MKHLAVIFLFSLSLIAQEVGVPFVFHYGPKTTTLASTKDAKTIFAARIGVIYRIELAPIKVSFSVKAGQHDGKWMFYPEDGREPYMVRTNIPTTINHIAVSPNERFIVTCGSDKLLKAWDAKTGKLLQTFTGHDSPVKGAVILADNKTLISGDENMTIKYWDILSAKEIRSFTVKAKAGEYNDGPEILHNLYLSNNGKILVVYDSYRVGFIDVKTNKVLDEYRHKGNFQANASYFHNDILYVLRDKFVLEYDVGKFSQLKEPTPHDIITIDPKKDFKDSLVALNSCITDENDILPILIHSRHVNTKESHVHTSPPLVLGKLKVYGAGYGGVILDQCPKDNNQIAIEAFGKRWFAITSDGYFNANFDVSKYLYMKNDLGKAIPIDDATYKKYHKILTVKKK